MQNAAETLSTLQTPAKAPPVAFDESGVSDRFWESEAWDEFLPSPGFITDYVLAFRGMESCTKFQVWSALHALSSVLKRDVWLKFDPMEFFLNLFVFLIGPPSTKKTSAIRWSEKITLRAIEKLSNPLRELKMPNILHSKATPEGLFRFLKPRKGISKDGRGVIWIKSNGTILSSELSAFLGRQQYNTGMIEMLTNFYDCAPAEDSQTQSRGAEHLKEMYLTLLGGTTPSGLSDSIPEQAFGDGFLSRVILVYQEKRTRCQPRPRLVEGGPTFDDLAERFAWIIQNANGEYTLAPEVIARYDEWYQRFWEAEVSNPDVNQRGMSRYDNHLLKLATLLRIQRYAPGNVVELSDFEEAQKLLKITIQEGFNATKEVGVTREERKVNAVEEYIRSKKRIDRRTLLTRNTRRFNSESANIALREMIQRGQIRISLNGRERDFPSNDSKEIYTWVEI